MLYLRDNPSVSRTDHQEGKYLRNSFYERPILMDTNSCILDSNGEVLVILLKDIIPEQLMQDLENTIKKYESLAARYSSTTDIRGRRISTRFGSYIEQGGSGKIWNRKSYPWCLTFLQEIQTFGDFVDNVFGTFCPEIASHVEKLPEDIKLWKFITQLYWNGSSVSKSHLDFKDFGYSIVAPFGNFTDSCVDLIYLNTIVAAKRKDLYLLRSSKVHHNVAFPEESRQSLVFTNHACVVKRFIENVDISNLYETLNSVD